MKYAQINSVPHGSTGSVMFSTQAMRIAAGDDCWALWGRGRSARNDREFNFGSGIGFCLDVAKTFVDDRAGFHSRAATRKLLAKLDEIDPDIVHLHNIHGYYVNIEMLFRWLESREQKTYWTLHDCWSFTGHCAYFTYAKCEQWKTHCPGALKCPQKGEYPISYFLDNSKRNYDDKRRLFTSLPTDKLTIITPSQWLADLVGQSFLSKYPVEVRHNEIDGTVFKPTLSDFRERYGIGKRFMILGVASPWDKRKGLGDFVQLARKLDNSYVVVLVGLSKRQIRTVSKDVAVVHGAELEPEDNRFDNIIGLFEEMKAGKMLGTAVAEIDACSERRVEADGSACTEAIEARIPDGGILSFDAVESSVISCQRGCTLILFERTESKVQLAELYTTADCLFNPTREDNYPTVNLEAESCGTPVLTYDTGGCAETVRLSASTVMEMG